MPLISTVSTGMAISKTPERMNAMPTILVVEDTKAEQQLISALLTQTGFEVASVETFKTAWQWLENHPLPSLILLDIVLPDESGLELCRQVREHSQWKEVPILFCSSKSEDFDRNWALRQGGNEYITKPFAPQQLVNKVCELC